MLKQKINFLISVGPGKNPKLVNVGPTFIQESRVGLYPQFSNMLFSFKYRSDSIKEWT